MGVESVQMLVGCALPWKRSYRWKRSWRSDIGFIQGIQIFSRKSFDQKDVFNKLRDVTEYLPVMTEKQEKIQKGTEELIESDHLQASKDLKDCLVQFTPSDKWLHLWNTDSFHLNVPMPRTTPPDSSAHLIIELIQEEEGELIQSLEYRRLTTQALSGAATSSILGEWPRTGRATSYFVNFYECEWSLACLIPENARYSIKWKVISTQR